MQADYCLPLPEGCQPLLVPVPPMLEDAMGYSRFGFPEARFVTFFWSPFGDEAYFDDGRTSGTGDWQGFLAYIEHPSVWPALGASRCQLGSSEEVNTHRLLLDRRERKLYLVEDRASCLVLSGQWQKSFEQEAGVNKAGELHPARPPETSGLSDLLDLILENWEQLKPPSQAKIEAYSQKKQRVLSNLFLWLDAHPAIANTWENRQGRDGERFPNHHLD